MGPPVEFEHLDMEGTGPGRLRLGLALTLSPNPNPNPNLRGGEPTTAGRSGSAPKLGRAPAMNAPAIGGGGGRRPG